MTPTPDLARVVAEASALFKHVWEAFHSADLPPDLQDEMAATLRRLGYAKEVNEWLSDD